MLLGIGIAMTMSRMTSAAMNAVRSRKPDRLGVLSMFRMVGGCLGIAVTGAIFQPWSARGRQQCWPARESRRADRSEISQQLGSGSVSGALKGLDPVQAKQAAAAGAEAFVYGLGNAMRVSALSR